MSGETVRCRHCSAEVDRADELAHHWYRDHDDELLEEELRAAIDEDVRRQRAHRLPVDVLVTIPPATWEYVCERVGVDPESTSPDEEADFLMNLLDLEFEYELEPRTVTECPNCSAKYTANEARSTMFDGTDARWQCPNCGEWSRGPPPGGDRQ